MGSGVSLRSAAYLGWRLPTLNELFRPFRAGPDATAANPLLDPERLAGAEAGLRYHRRSIELELTGFVNRLSGAIANVTLGHGPGVFPGVGFVAGDFSQRQNLDAVNVRGIEASAEFRRGPWLLRAGASFSHARVNFDRRGSRPRRPPTGADPESCPHREVGWHDGAKAVSLLFRRTGAQFEDDLNTQRMGPATTIDAFAAWPPTHRLQLIARAQNLLDETVIATLGSDGTIERATPRTLWIGLRFGGF